VTAFTAVRKASLRAKPSFDIHSGPAFILLILKS